MHGMPPAEIALVLTFGGAAVFIAVVAGIGNLATAIGPPTYKLRQSLTSDRSRRALGQMPPIAQTHLVRCRSYRGLPNAGRFDARPPLSRRCAAAGYLSTRYVSCTASQSMSS